jgi:hypothetical protein
MAELDRLEILFVVWAFLFQIILIAHFSLRKWSFPVAQKYGWVVYAFSVPAAIIAVLLLVGDKPWSLWVSGFLHLTWAIYGYAVEYVRKVRWRNPIRWPIFGPYVSLYLATIMFYWWPLGIVSRPLWYVYAVLFVLSTILNVSSHKGAG